MWENTVKRRFWRNIVLAVLCVVAIVALFFALAESVERQKNESVDLNQVSTQREAEQQESVNQAVGSIEALYQRDLDAIATYLPGIVCWGDTLTRGTSGNVSYPNVLQSFISSEICELYDFGSTVESTVVYAQFFDKEYKVSIPVVNMGGGDESAATVLARAGAIPFTVKKDFVIPADTTPVEIDLGTSISAKANPLTVGDQSLNPVWIDGIEGTLSVRLLRSSNSYSFTRSTAGEEHKVAAGSSFVCSGEDRYANYIHVIWLGAYETRFTSEEYMSWCETLLSRQVQNPDRFIILGPCSFGGSWTKSIAILDQVDSDMMAKYGEHYINLRKYFLTDGLKDAGIAKTKTDDRDIGRGYVPTSLRSSNGSVELSSQAYELVGKLVFERMIRLGYFSEICDELCIIPGKEQTQ